MQYEILSPAPLLLADGSLGTKGYAKRMNVIYNREKVKAFPLQLKEWNFYQMQCGNYVLQITLGHVSYVCSISTALMDITTGKKWEFGTMKPMYIPKLDRNPEKESVVQFADKDFFLAFQVTRDKRILTVKGKNKTYQNVQIEIQLDNDPANEKMVISTPFEKKHQFYLNYKENYYSGTGSVTFDDMTVSFDGCTGLLDWGRGIWPYRHEWFWGNLTADIEGVPFGFNIGWGFGDLKIATENMFFYNKKAYKLGTLKITRDENDYMNPWHLCDEENGFELHFTPLWDNYTENKLVVVDTHCNQVFGTFSGTIQTKEGTKTFSGLTAFIEHAVNRW